MSIWILMPTGNSSNQFKEEIIRDNFSLMGRSVDELYVYKGSYKELIPFTVKTGKFANVVLQQRYDLAQTAFKNNLDYNNFDLSFVRDKSTFIINEFLESSPRRIIAHGFKYVDAQTPIIFYYDPDDEVGLASCKYNLKSFASPDILFSQPWCEFDRASKDLTKEVWINSLVEKNQSIRLSWGQFSCPSRAIAIPWTYSNTTTPIQFELVDQNLDFAGIHFQQSFNHWAKGNRITLRSVCDMNQALRSILKRINCRLINSKFDYYSFSQNAQENFLQKFEVVDEFGKEYQTSIDCLTKGMNQFSVGAGQLPWKRGSSRITPNKIRKDQRLMASKAILYLSVITSVEGDKYLKIGLTTKERPNLRYRDYEVLVFTERRNLLDIAILEQALLRFTAKDQPKKYREIKFPGGFGGGNSEIRNLPVFKDLFINKAEAKKAIDAMAIKANNYQDVRRLSGELIREITSCLRSTSYFKQLPYMCFG